MKNLIKWLKKARFPYKPLITVYLDRSSLIHNIKQFLTLAPEGHIAPTLKSNAYGHGIVEIASIIENEFKNDSSLKSKIPFFCIDSYFEAMTLRSRGIKTPLLIIGFTRPEDILISNLKNTSFAITSLHMLSSIKNTTNQIKIHLKIDTGMNRQGIKEDEVDQAIFIIQNNPNIILEGIFSHFFDADSTDKTNTEHQIDRWNKIVNRFQKSLTPKFIHISNTAGHNYTGKAIANLSRLGIGLYGLYPIPNLNINPVLSLKTIVTGVKKIDKGELVGYNGTFCATKLMKIATIPVGYFEALDRRLSNIGFVKIHDKDCPIIGRISMNITKVDVSHLDNISIGDEVLVISDHYEDKNSITNMAKLCKTVEYENAIRIPQHLKRVIV